MSEPAIVIRLEGNGRTYHPGETLGGEYRVASVRDEELTAIEVSVLWYTEGKGDEDLAVHQFWRRERDGTDWTDPCLPQRFSTVLPRSPLSYEGLIVKIRWCVRVRVFFERGKELVGQKVFRLGCVPAVKTARAGSSRRLAKSAAPPDARGDLPGPQLSPGSLTDAEPEDVVRRPANRLGQGPRPSDAPAPRLLP